MTDIEQQQAVIQLLSAQQQQILQNATTPDAPQVAIINDQLVVVSDALAAATAELETMLQ